MPLNFNSLNFNPFGSKRRGGNDQLNESLLHSLDERSGDSNTEAGANNTATSDSSKQTSSTLSRFTSPFKKAVEAASAFTKTKKHEDALNPSQETKDALNSACRLGDLKTCEALIGKKAGVDTDLDCGATTPLMHASEAGHKNIVEFLIDKQANLNLQNSQGKTALTLACSNGRSNIADILIGNNANVDLIDLDGYGALHRAIMHGCSEQVVGSLIEKVANVDLQNSRGEAALHWASKDNHGIVKKLIQAKANLDLTTKAGLSPLHIASQEGNRDNVAILLNAGANVDLATPDTKETPLHLACGKITKHYDDESFAKKRKKLLETAKILIGAKANLNAVDSEGETALFKACKNGHADIVKALLSAGATLDGRAKEGELSSEISPEMKSLIAKYISETKLTQGISHDPGSAPVRPSAIDVESTVKLPNSEARTPS